MYEPEGLEFEYTVMKHRYCYWMAQSSEFRVWSLGIVQNFTEVKQDGGFLDVGFSSCTVPTSVVV